MRSLGLIPADVPVDPDAPEAHRWIVDELSKPIYHDAQPSWLQQLIASINNWLNSLLHPITGENTAPFWMVLVGVIVLALILIAFLVVGVPRLRRRSRVENAVFNPDDERDAAALRRDAARAADVLDWRLAIAEQFRAIARSLDERAILTTSPGTTAHSFALLAAPSFPDHAIELDRAASRFDAVRYLGETGSRGEWEELVALDGALRSARPVLADEPALPEPAVPR